MLMALSSDRNNLSEASANEFSEEPRIGGTLVSYATICLRQVWLMARCIEPDERNELLILGRLADESGYQRDKHNIPFGNNRFDIVRKEGETLVVSEIKKSSRSLKAARLQILHYLYELKKNGVEARGELLFSEERKKEQVQLNEESMHELDVLYSRIQETAGHSTPPEPIWGGYCKKCAYNEFCWS
jgi:CRISPR-associated exonuclease Cas4